MPNACECTVFGLQAADAAARSQPTAEERRTLTEWEALQRTKQEASRAAQIAQV